MNILKAVITAAGRTQRTLPLQTLVDRDGAPRTVLNLLVDEALAAGVESIAVVIHPGDQAAYAAAAGPHATRLEFIEQKAPKGYGHAVYCAGEFVGDDGFLLMVGDHVYVSAVEAGCARQLTDAARIAGCGVSAVQATHETKLPYFGAVGGRRLQGAQGFYEVTEVLEKPTPTEAEQRLQIPGLRTGHYLCFFGMHVLPPSLVRILGEMVGTGAGSWPLSPALAHLARRERLVAFEALGRRYDLGAKYGLLTAQMALALSGQDREEVLAGLVELLAQRGNPQAGKTP
jgi:UTP--glucose-1-phosphate uridylyltransferase